MMAKALNKLAFSSRENINEEIHGVCCLAPEETPEMLNVALQKLSEAVDKIPSADKQAYLQSQSLFPDNRYVNDRNFPLMFLRCELFDAQRAAMRMVRHLDFVLEIFDNNKELLQRPIRLTDLGSRAMKLLRSGCLQLLPVRDSAGRRVFVVTAFKSEYEVVDRVSVYIFLSIESGMLVGFWRETKQNHNVPNIGNLFFVSISSNLALSLLSFQLLVTIVRLFSNRFERRC